MSFWRPAGRTTGLSAWRPVVVTTGVAAVGAAVLSGAVSSTSSGAGAGPSVASVTVVSDVAALEAPQAVKAADPVLYGFAPPAEKEAAVAAQFRLAANLPDGPLGIPGVVLQAYKLGATRVAAESPQCRLPWFLLAGIGRIESGHAGNGNVDAFGNTRTKIRGPVLDGSLAGNAVIRDTDGGRLDGDASHDRAMGPMQFIPSTWAAWGSDANGDGKADPDNIFDAAYSAGRYLCAGYTDIMSDANKVSAVLRYNRSIAYANNVLGWAAAYATGVIPTQGIPEMSDGPATGPDAKDKEKADKDKADKSRSEKDKADKSRSDKDKPGATSDESAPGDGTSRTAPKTTRKPPETCLGAICLPPGMIPAPAPAPQPKKKSAPAPQAPTKSAAPAPGAKKPASSAPAAGKPAAVPAGRR